MSKNLIKKTLVFTILALFTYSCGYEKINNTTLSDNNFKVENFNNEKYLLGGSASTFDNGKDAFGHVSQKLSFEDKAKFLQGESFFDQKWLVAPSASKGRDGLGPFFNGNSCAVCHIADGRGRPPKNGEEMESMLLRLSITGKGKHNEPLPSHSYGGQLQGFSIPGIKPEAKVTITYEDINGFFADGEKYTLKKPIYHITNTNYGDLEKDLMISPRVANQMSGMGLLEDIAEKDILALEDPDDRDGDGISGKANYVWDEEKQKVSLGRFGWKSNQPSIRQQVAGAFLGDIGITTPIFSNEDVTTPESIELKAKKYINGGNTELNEKNMSNVVIYSRNLSVPTRRDINNLEVIKGERIFSTLSCNKCHITTMKSQGEIIHPYTDLLLHDVGDELADNRPDFMATGNEWRTPPLWTIGLFKVVNNHTNYMHDGRANNLTEAILWHGGEANKSKEDFKKLPKTEREALIKFLNTL